MLCARIQLWLRKQTAEQLFLVTKEGMKTGSVGSLEVFYKDELFLMFVREALNVLMERDPLNYRRVQTSIRGIIESPVNEYWAGRAIGIYFDSVEERARFSREPGRYAARLVRFATEVRILKSHKIINILRNGGKNYDRVVRISTTRELICCENIGCPMRDLFDLRRLLGDCKIY